MTTLELRGLRKRFGSTEVLHGIDLDVAEGEFVVFVGPSGCGKSTLLRCIAGLDAITAGVVRIDGRDMTHAHPSERQLAMVFQSYALYPHMTVAQNLSFGMRMRGLAKPVVAQKMARAVSTLQLEPYLDRKPGQLSGGQCQRVAIGRALVQEPRVFLFDEPLSNLDAELRLHMRVELATLHRELGRSMIYVTHDQVEAMTLADRIVVLRNGRIEQVGPPMELYANPVNAFVAGFIGSPAMNLLPVDAVPGAPVCAQVGVRPEHWLIDAPNSPGCLLARVSMVERLGASSYVYAETAWGRVCALLPAGSPAHSGDAIGLRPQPGWFYAFDAAGLRVGPNR
jgi:ABC-type sugar transport system ATPase subunit